MIIKKVLTGISASLVMALSLPMMAGAASSYTLFGDATMVSPGNGSNTAVQTVSSESPGYGGINFDVPAGTTFANIETLSTDYKITDGDCAGGSPRFQLETATGNIFVYLGPSPNYTGCQLNTWVNSGDLLASGLTVDATQVGGTFYNSYDDAVTALGNTIITSVDLVTDGGWAMEGDQVVLFDNVNIDSAINTFEAVTLSNKDQCKKDGWKTSEAPVFKNQGACVSYFASNGKSGGNTMNISNLKF